MAPSPPSPARSQLRVLVRPGDGEGFRLAGAAVEEVPAGEEAPRMRAALADEGAAVLAVETSVLGTVPEPLLRRAAERGRPVILPFTLPRRLSEAAAGRAYVAALIRRAIGYHVKLEERR